jgi:hypothetical protein
MKKVLFPILAVIIFLVMQAIAGIIIVVIKLVQDPGIIQLKRNGGSVNEIIDRIMTGDVLGCAVIMSGILTIAAITLMNMIEWHTAFNVKMIDWKSGLWAILGAVLAIFQFDIYEDMLQLPNDMEDLFISMSHTLVGALSISLVGPIIEELIFREGILGYMLRHGVNKWGAITASALVFGLIHLNPAQIPFAAAMGFVLGLIYYKTGNIVIPCILHILNNSIFTLMTYLMGDAAKDYSMTESLGGPVYAVLIAIAVGTISFVILRFYWQSSKQNINYETVS